MSKVIIPGQTIGILGGGQLGRMMALSAREMGYKIAVMEPKKNSPTGQIADVEVIASYDDQSGAREMAEHCDVFTYEFENIEADTAGFLESHLYLPQGKDLLFITQHRIREKKAIQEAGVEVAPYKEITSLEDLEASIQELGLPAVLKTCRGGYDGKGQVVIQQAEEAEKAYSSLKESGELVLEAWIPFKKEISVIVTRSTNGETATFPLGENIHVHNILHQTIVPARVEAQVKDKAETIALQLAEHIKLVGTLAVEMFLTEEDTIYVNELAPRPHNSGHYTINACETSQFAQHIRAICGLPLGKTDLLKPAVMTNILGEDLPKVLDHVQDIRDAHLHLYGKEEARPQRKMGHITVMGESVEEALGRTSNLGLWNK
ncbi:5-(carboxyamino)imidazole ribonucleotide synthase [Thalassorhabdus alkalitolerans]|uniref:N5-carboxyaminoimidazole ribonucleotide synthase n=1 Tax=Thalassorhabdus alkalitolerans TaxID=2282697 RepID=A0ABW0YRZ3_9BACI